MMRVRFPGRAAYFSAALAVLLCVATVAPAADSAGRLRKEKSRLIEMRQRAEKAATELSDTLKREKMTKEKVAEIQGRLSRQRKLIARIDTKLEALAHDLGRTESEVKAIEEEREKTLRLMGNGAFVMDAGRRERPAVVPGDAAEERLRYFGVLVLGAERDRYARFTAEREGKMEALSGIERRIEQSERRMAAEKQVGATLRSRQEEERKKLSDIGREKKKKEAEVRALRARIARMEALVSRIERQVRARDSKEAAPRKAAPTKFSGIAGGLAPPLQGKIVGRYGSQRDPVFDVNVESRGVEIEAASGAAVHAVGKGEAVFVGPVTGFGKVLILQHGSGLFSVYGKAASFSVGQGQRVAKGEEVGRLPEGPEGKSVLYLELRVAGTAIDPASVIPFSP